MTTAALVLRRDLEDDTALLYYADGSVWQLSTLGRHQLEPADVDRADVGGVPHE